MKKILIVLVAGLLVFSVAKANAGMLGAYGEWLGSAWCGGVGGGVTFDVAPVTIKAGVHYSLLSGINFGGGVKYPLPIPLMDKLTLSVDGEFHFALAGIASFAFWDVPIMGVIEYKLADNMSVYGGAGVTIYPTYTYTIDWASLSASFTPTVGVTSSYVVGVGYKF